ncbi:MAG: hypothetical protein ACR2KV_13880 [Solirubrobacteraceae bacterium]
MTAVGLVAVVGGGGYLALGATGHGTRRVATTPTPAPAPAPTRTVPRSAPGGTAGGAAHGLRVPFVVGGARYAVFRNPLQGWTAFERTDPGGGLRWLAVTVRVRNLAMAGVDPRVLDFRVAGRGGASYVAEPGLGTEPARRQPPRPLAVGGLVEARLGFRIPVSTGDLLLRFRPSRGSPAIIVALGP